MKLSNKQILKIFEHCTNPLRQKLTKKNYMEEIVKPLNMINNLGIQFEVQTGVSKLCLIPLDEDNNFVIKIPFTGIQCKNKYLPFHSCGDGFTDLVGNYCDIEAQRCKFIIEQGWGDYIAKTALIGIVGDLYIYKQEKVTIIAEEKEYHDVDENKLCEAEDIADSFGNIDAYWVMDLIDYIGEEKANNFLDFLEIEGFTEDLHGANVGFIGSRPVLLDYSDFNDDY